MRTNVPANGQRGSEADASPGAALLELLRRGTLARLLPLASEASLAAEAELRRRFRNETLPQTSYAVTLRDGTGLSSRQPHDGAGRSWSWSAGGWTAGGCGR